MKKRLLTCLSISSLMMISFSVLLINNSNKVEEVKGYDKNSLTKDIDLNDTSEADIRQYYSSLNEYSSSDRAGTNLLKRLKEILKEDQKYYKYDSDSDIWRIYEISDRDWEKSPASQISGYNPSTNKITNYTYGTSYSSPGTNPFIHALYVDRNTENLMRAWKKDNDSHQRNNHGQNAEWYIDREHIWPKSHGFSSDGGAGARGDPMHLWPGDSEVNSNTHGNFFYGYVNLNKTYATGQWSYAKDNYSGSSLTINNSSNKVFEPQDCDKGDIARAIFYMAARYNYLSGEDIDGIDQNNPNLTLINDISGWANVGYDSSKTKAGTMAILTDLLNWHKIDPPDEWEIHRNNLLYANFTNNRNPFIDFPEWADFIWGKAVYNGRNYSSYSSTPTGYANPTSDTINGYNGGTTDPVPVTGINLDKDEITVEEGKSDVLTATFSPSNATNKGVKWTSSDTTVATVSSGGTVVGISEGTATITVKTDDGGFTDTCSVTVTKSSGGEGQTVSTSIQDYASANNWSNGVKYLTVNLDDNVTITASGGSNTGKYYTTGQEWRYYQTETPSVTVTVPEGYELDSVTFTFNSSNTGALFDSNNNEVTSGSEVELTGNSAIFTIGNSGTATNGQVKFTNLSVTYHQNAIPVPVLTSISVKIAPTKTSYLLGEDFSPSGLVLSATYDEKTTVDVIYEDDPDAFDFDPEENLQLTDTSVTISYGGLTCSQPITVISEPTLFWTAPNINVYSGAVLTGEMTNSWDVTYIDNQGVSSKLSYNQFTVKLDDTVISLPYTWKGSDDGKTLTVSYNSLTAEGITVSVTQTLQNIYKESAASSEISSLIFTKKCDGTGTADDDKSWTVTSDANESTFDSTKGIHYGTGSAAVQYIKLTSSSFTIGKITKVVVNASTANGVTATVGVKINNAKFGGDPQSLTNSAAEYTFTGEANAASIEVEVTKPSSAKNALYVKSIVVTYLKPGSEVNIANIEGHEAAQKAVVKFAKAFNAAMDATSGCTVNMTSAWNNATSAWNTFISEIGELTSSEEEYAKDLIANAYSRWTKGTDSDYSYSLERALATYDKCVSTHGQTPFMNGVRAAEISHIVNNNSNVYNDNDNAFMIIIIAALATLSMTTLLIIKKKRR